MKTNVGKNQLEKPGMKSSPHFSHFTKTEKIEEQLLQEISANKKRWLPPEGD